jgi:hypothetical protein
VKKIENCPGSGTMDFRDSVEETKDEAIGRIPSELKQWPIQMHLISPNAPYFLGADVLLTADCVAYALGGYHRDFLKGKSLAIACPKLDSMQEVYIDKITSLIDDAEINTLTIMIMQVPCCRGLVGLVQKAVSDSKRKIPIKYMVVGIQGEILQDDWLPM